MLQASKNKWYTVKDKEEWAAAVAQRSKILLGILYASRKCVLQCIVGTHHPIEKALQPRCSEMAVVWRPRLPEEDMIFWPYSVYTNQDKLNQAGLSIESFGEFDD